MSDKTVLIIGEGKGEIGNDLDQPLNPDDGLPALPRLVHRLSDEPENGRYVCWKLSEMVRHHARSRPAHSATPKKSDSKTAIAARVIARNRDYVGAVLVVDCDGPDGTVRMDNLKVGRDYAAFADHPPLALGQAVEAFDAWMIADGLAIGQADGDAENNHPQPEKLTRHKHAGQLPKERAAEIFGVSSDGTGLGKKYPIVAQHVDLGFLERACPEGFKPFADEVRKHIAPVVSE
ncbi:MAG: hypothetical protein ACOC8F_00225 [Planctomycetota bacterium]